MKVQDFATPDIVFRMGLPPNQIDILTSITGVEFDQAWPHRVEHQLDGLKVHVIGVQNQIENKRATDRPKDKVDADWLERKKRGEV